MPDFTVIDGLFAELLAASKAYLTPEEMSEVQHFVDVAEYGVALETFVYIFVEGGKSATQDMLSLITRLTGMMQMELDEPIRKIARL